MSEFTEQHYTTFYPNTRVQFIKISQDIFTSLPEALKSIDIFTMKDVFQTEYPNLQIGINAHYLDPRNKISTEVEYVLFKKTPQQTYWSLVWQGKQGEFSIDDYGIKNDEYYTYMLIANYCSSDISGAIHTIGTNLYDNDTNELVFLKPHAQFWTITDISENETGDGYIKIGHTWNLGIGTEDEDITVNHSVSSQDTLGRYPRFSKGPSNYDSMTFTGLLGNIYCYDEYYFKKNNKSLQQGTLSQFNKEYKNTYTEKLEEKTYDATGQEIWTVINPWATESQKLQMWKNFITNGNLKLIKDIKGNAWIVAIDQDTSYQISNGSSFKQTQISFSWKEVDSFQDTSIIKTKELKGGNS